MSQNNFGLIFYLLFIGFSQICAQGYCAKYTCEQNKDFSSTFILKCTSDGPGLTSNRSSNFDCTADLHQLDLKLGITLCSQTIPSYSLNVLPDATASLEYQRLYRYLQVVAGRQTTINSRCYFRNIPPPGTQTTPNPFVGTTTRAVMTYHISRSVFIGSVIGAFFGGVLVAAIILVSIYCCCANRRKETKRFVTPRINEAYRRDPNDNIDDTPIDLRQKDWSQEHRGRMERINGVINAFTLENVVDTYASIGTNNHGNSEVDLDNDPPIRPTPPRPSAEEISAMYSKIDRAKKRRSPNGRTGELDKAPSSNPSTRDIYIKDRNDMSIKEHSETVASSAEIVQPENSLHLYHILEKPEP